MKVTADSTGSITHYRFQYFLKSPCCWITKWLTIHIKGFVFSEVSQIFPTMPSFVPQMFLPSSIVKQLNTLHSGCTEFVFSEPLWKCPCSTHKLQYNSGAWNSVLVSQISNTYQATPLGAYQRPKNITWKHLPNFN